MHVPPHYSYNLCNTLHSKDVRNCWLVCKALCREHKAMLSEPSLKCPVNAFFCLEFCSMARGLLLVHTWLLWRIDGSHPCLDHPAQQSNAPHLEDWLTSAGGVLKGVRLLFFFFFLMQIYSNNCPRLSHNQELLVHLFMKYSKMQARTSQP